MVGALETGFAWQAAFLGVLMLSSLLAVFYLMPVVVQGLLRGIALGRPQRQRRRRPQADRRSAVSLRGAAGAHGAAVAGAVLRRGRPGDTAELLGDNRGSVRRPSGRHLARCRETARQHPPREVQPLLLRHQSQPARELPSVREPRHLRQTDLDGQEPRRLQLPPGPLRLPRPRSAAAAFAPAARTPPRAGARLEAPLHRTRSPRAAAVRSAARRRGRSCWPRALAAG